MGVPVVTLLGHHFAGRMAGDIVVHAGLEEMAVSSKKAYVECALALASDLDRLRNLRSGLRERLRASPLCDGAAYARSVENLYRSLWERSRNQQVEHG